MADCVKRKITLTCANVCLVLQEEIAKVNFSINVRKNKCNKCCCLGIMGNFCFFFLFFFVIVEDHCYSQPCLNNGSCENSANGYQCKCVMGFQGHNCQGEGIKFKHKTSIKQEYMHQEKRQVEIIKNSYGITIFYWFRLKFYEGRHLSN